MIGLVLLVALPNFIDAHLPWWISGLLVLAGLGIYGAPDWRRFSIKRVWAISSVVFAESIRRRVLLIVLVAIPGIIIVSQLQNPTDEQDAIRQTTKVCLFTSGIVVVMTAIILACTNLPREIESRVIFTVVTKPTTRLEIVVGKILGFTRVSATVLVLMGLFSYGYLQFRSQRLMAFVDDQLQHGDADFNRKASLEFYRSSGLLAAHVYAFPIDLQMYSRLPQVGDEIRYIRGQDGSIMVPFSVTPDQLRKPGMTADDDAANDDAQEMIIEIKVGVRKGVSATQPDQLALGPTTLPYLIQNPNATAEQVIVHSRTQAESSAVQVGITDSAMHTLVDPAQINGAHAMEVADHSGTNAIQVPVTADGVQKILSSESGDKRVFFVSVSGMSNSEEYSVGLQPVKLRMADGRTIEPLVDSRGTMARPIFVGHENLGGMQVRGGSVADAPATVYRFHGATLAGQSVATFELNVAIERDDADTIEERPTKLEMRIRNRSTKQLSDPVYAYPDSRRTTYFAFPVSAIPDKDFDLMIRCLTSGHYVTVDESSISLVTENQGFFFNLVKSLFVMWLLTLLVVIVAVFASTFVSWPIAIVLTVLILLGHWGVEQLGDSLQPGLGNQIATEWGLQQANLARTVSRSVDSLSKMLNAVGAILPDISQFGATEDLEHGAALPWSRIGGSLSVLAIFGLPMTVLAYIFLRRKEVAP